MRFKNETNRTVVTEKKADLPKINNTWGLRAVATAATLIEVISAILTLLAWVISTVMAPKIVRLYFVFKRLHIDRPHLRTM